jgi:hypothetical protein
MPSVPTSPDVDTPPPRERIEQKLHTKMGCDPFHFITHWNLGMRRCWQPSCQDVFKNAFGFCVGGDLLTHCYVDEGLGFGLDFDTFAVFGPSKHCEARGTLVDSDRPSVVNEYATTRVFVGGLTHVDRTFVGL